MGPAVVLRGQATGGPRVSGRLRSVRVSPDNQRVYAGSALGGLWYSADGGTRWTSLDLYASTRDASGKLNDSNALAVGAVAVRFVDAAHDLVLVGTGERPPTADDLVRLQGVGIRVATGPVQQVLDHGVAVDPWTLEATNLTGQSVSRLAFDLVNPDVVWAATSSGLYRRPATGSRASWDFVDAGLGHTWVTDVVVVPGLTGEAERVYAVSAAGVLVRSTDGTHFSPVTLPADPNPALVGVPVAAAVLAAGNDPARPVVWMLAGGPRLWRVDADTAQYVTGLPADLYGAPTALQTSWDIGLAVHPSTAPAQRDLVAVGGSVAHLAGVANASLYAGRVSAVAGVLTFPSTPGPTLPAGPSGGNRGEWIGRGVHPDVHDLAWIGAAVPATVWVTCDGGLFRSDNDGAAGSFRSRNTGLATLQTERVALHPRLPGHVLAGTQDNAAVRTVSASGWAVVVGGDAGGVAIDPDLPSQLYQQYVRARWFQSTDAGASYGTLNVFSPSLAASGSAKDTAWTTATTAEIAYPVTDLAMVANESAAAGSQLVLGTQRVWYRDEVTLAAAAAVGGTGWVTLPTGTDPYLSTLAAPAPAQDRLDALVLALQWSGPDRLYVLTERSVYALRRTAGAWQPLEHLYDQAAVHRNWKGRVPDGQVPDTVRLLEIAVHDPDRGTHGSVYLGVSGDSDQHNLWWYDGSAAWRHTGLALGSPVRAITVDPVDPTVVFAGTDIGVFRGVATFPATGDPSWVWAQYSDALPEAAVYDLAVQPASDGGPRLLRAALAGRGVWEVAIDGSTVGPTTYLQAQDLDARRGPTPFGGAEDVRSTSRTQARLDASPDLRIWRADTAGPPVPVQLPVLPSSPEYDIWLLQSALKAGGEDVTVDGTWRAELVSALAHRITVLGGALPVNPTAQQVWTALWATNRLPFEATPPDATDLVAHLRERPDLDRKGFRASCLADDGVARVFVTVHGRHWKALAPDRVQVALLRVPYGRHANLAGTPPLPLNWATNLAADRTAAAVGLWLTGGWEYVDLAHPFRSLPAPLDPDNPQVVTFDADLGGPAWAVPGYLLLAVVVSDDDPITSAETDVARLVATDRHVAARSVRRSHAATPPVPVGTALVAGMDQGSFGGAAAMARAWESSNLAWTGLYLDSPLPVPGEVPVPPNVVAGHNRLGGTAGHPAGAWMAAFALLWPDWGIAPIYWGQQDPANAQGPFDLRPQIATANAQDAATKAAAAGIRPGAVIYLDWEAGGAPSVAALTYLRTFCERLGELGFRAGVYAHPNAALAIRREIPGVFVWAVSCVPGRATCTAQPGDVTLSGGRVWYPPQPMPAADMDALARQWSFDSPQPAGSPLLPFGKIDETSAVVADPGFPERRPQPVVVRPGGVTLLPAAAGGVPSAVTVLRVSTGRMLALGWAPATPGPGTTVPDPTLNPRTTRHWWNPFASLSAVHAPAANSLPSVDWVAGLGYEHLRSTDPVLSQLEAGPDGWRVQMLERGPGGWRLTTVPDGGLVVDPLGGVGAVVRGGSRVEVIVLTDDGTPATSSALPGTRSWLGLAPVCPPGSASARPTCRPVLVNRNIDDVDALWLGMDGRLRAAHSTGAGAWAAPAVIGDPAVEVHPLGALMAASVGVGQVDVAYLGRAGAGAPWSVFVTGWTTAQGWGDASHTAHVGGPTLLSSLSRISMVSPSAGALAVLAVSAAGTLLVTSRPAIGQAWTALTAVGGAPLVNGAPLRISRVEACQTAANGSVVVVAPGREGGTWLTRLDGPTGTWSTFEPI
jgi:Domain of unknown function (DUF1906)